MLEEIGSKSPLPLPHTHTHTHAWQMHTRYSERAGRSWGGRLRVTARLGVWPPAGCQSLRLLSSSSLPTPYLGPNSLSPRLPLPPTPAPNLGNRRDNRSRVRPRHQAEAAVWDKEVRRRGEDFACRWGRGELPRLPPPYFVREGASSTRGAAWSVWERRVGANLPRWRRPAPGRCCCCCCCCS